MEPYWTKSFDVDGTDCEIKLFQYSAKCIAMVSTGDFGRKFSSHFKEIGGRFNPKLSVGAGWIFKLDSQSNLTEVLRKIYKKELLPKETEFKSPLIDENDTDTRIFNALNELINLLPEGKEERVLSETDSLKTTVYYNKDDETVTEGNCIYTFSSAHKKMDIYQLEL